MPGTTYRVANQETVGERPVVMRAMRAHREKGVAAPREDGLVAIDTARHDRPVRKVAKRETVSEIWFGKVWLAHLNVRLMMM